MRSLIIAIICLTFSAACCGAEQAEVRAILSSDIPQYRQALDGFRDTIQERKGALRIAQHNLDKEGGDGIVQQIDREKPLLVFAIGPEASKLAKERIKNIPVVFAMVLNPHPLAGPNVTGVSMDIPVRAKLERIRRMLPDARRIGVVYSPGSAHLFREVVQESRAMGLQATGREIASGVELHDAFDDLAKQIDLFLMLTDTKIYFPKSVEFILKEALKHKVPMVGLASSYTRAGALVSFEADFKDLGRQAGEIAARIIDGEKPGSIEPARPRKVKTSLNLAVAERLGIRLDPQVIGEASDVFK